MTIKDFISNYNLHDSLVTQIIHNDNKQTIVLEVEFSFWMQDNYDEKDSEVGMIRISFLNVKSSDLCELNGAVDYYSILDVILDGNNLELHILDDFNDELFKLKIDAQSVEVIKL